MASILSKALTDFSIDIKLKPDFSEAWYNLGIAEYYSGSKEAACKDLNLSANLGNQQAVDALVQLCQ